MRNAGLEETQAGIKIAWININNLRYADDPAPRFIKITHTCTHTHTLTDTQAFAKLDFVTLIPNNWSM